ncbi:MAG: fumarylacetoacetate hydrolase family protein [Balneolaceae bacterium]
MNPFKIPEFNHLTAGSIYCIGRNYARHALELNNPVPNEPVVFLKPRSSLIFGNGNVTIPVQSESVHHEVEMVLLIGKKAKRIQPDETASIIEAISVGIDLTARDIQQKAKEKGQPWSIAKGFDTFAPVGNFVPFETIGDLNDLILELSINDKICQQGNTKDMLFPVEKIIAYLTSIFTLYPGDLIFTGTPEGVGEIHTGDIITAKLGNQISTLMVHVT